MDGGEAPAIYNENDINDNSISSTMDADPANDDPCVFPELATAADNLGQHQQGRRRRISFSPTVDVREIPHLKDLSTDEIKSTYYNSSDFDAIKKSIVTTLRQVMTNRKPSDDDEECLRGLEPRIPQLAKLRKSSRINCLSAVWSQQVISWETNTSNEVVIAIECSKQSSVCQNIARRTAIHDEQVAKMYQSAPDDEPTVPPTEILCKRMEFTLIQNLVSLSREVSRRQAVRDDIKQFVDNQQSSTPGTTTTTTTTQHHHATQQSVCPVAV